MKRLTSKNILRICLTIMLFSFMFLSQAQVQLNETHLLAESIVEYEAKDERETIIGKAPIQDLELSLNIDNLGSTSLNISVDPAKFDSQNGIRDTNARRTVFETKEFPEIRFESTRVISTDAALSEGQASSVELIGTLSMHGVSKELSSVLTASINGDTLTVEGGFEVLLTDFEMSRPSFLVWTIEDTVIIRYLIKLKLE